MLISQASTIIYICQGVHYILAGSGTKFSSQLSHSGLANLVTGLGTDWLPEEFNVVLSIQWVDM